MSGNEADNKRVKRLQLEQRLVRVSANDHAKALEIGEAIRCDEESCGPGFKDLGRIINGQYLGRKFLLIALPWNRQLSRVHFPKTSIPPPPQSQPSLRKNVHSQPTRPAALFSRRKVGRGASAQSPTNPPRVPSAIATRYPITLRPRITVALWPTLAAVDLALIVSTKIQSFVTRDGVIVIAI